MFHFSKKRITYKILENIYTEHEAYLLRYCLGITGDRYRAEDILSSVMEYIFKNPKSFLECPSSNHRAYLKKACLRAYLLDIKKEQKELETAEKFYINKHLAEETPDVPETVIRNVSIGRIADILYELNTDDMKIFILYYYCGVTQGEIASSFGVSTSTISRKLDSLRKEIAQKMEKEGYYDVQ